MLAHGFTQIKKINTDLSNEIFLCRVCFICECLCARYFSIKTRCPLWFKKLFQSSKLKKTWQLKNNLINY